MSTGHYKSNLRDVFFNLFEFLNISDHCLGKDPYSSMDESTAKEILSGLEKICSNEMASSFRDGDQIPLTLDEDHNVTLPPNLTKSLKAYYDGDWHLLDFPQKMSGFGASRTLYWAGYEMLSGANAACSFYIFGSLVPKIIEDMGTQSQKDRFVKATIDGKWGGTMVLTEPDAGSDVGSATTKAKHIKDDIWELEGVKRFITNGDYDLPDNIVHLVLARAEGAESGTKGLSLFVVPKFWVNEDGSLGERNGVFCTMLEKKMGIKGSSTAELTFGDKKPAKGFLLGNKHDGIRQMFKVIEQARMAVGTKSMATLSTAYLNALEFTKERVQGSDLANIMDKSAKKVAIINHPDVKRMLMTQKCFAEGLRGFCSYVAFLQDQLEIAQSANDTNKAREYHKMVDLLLPLVKGYNSEKVYELLSLSLQCFGGSGYLKDYPIEQYIRDQKIDSLYEGVTHIQALDLIFRKIAKDGGETLQKHLGNIKETIAHKKYPIELKDEYDSLEEGIADVEAIFSTMMQKMGQSLYHVGLQGNKILFTLAELTIGWLLVRQAEVALQKCPKATNEDRLFYSGKIAATRFYCENILPQISFNKKIIEKSNLKLMQLSQDEF